MTRRSNPAAVQAEALRALADELEAGTRQLSPEMAKALEHELAREDDDDYETLTPTEWEEVWGAEIDKRLADYRAGKSKKHDFGAFLEELRARR